MEEKFELLIQSLNQARDNRDSIKKEESLRTFC